MSTPKALFIADPALGLEMVISSGNAISYPVHTHVSATVVGLVRQGTVRLAAGGKTRRIRAGGLFRIEPNQAHSLEATAPYALLTLCLARSRADLAGTPASEKAADFLDRLARSGLISRQESTRLKTVLPRPGSHETEEKADAIDRLRAAIEAHPEDDVDLGEAAAAAGVGVFHLIRAFRRRYGLPPRKFQIQNRIRKAKREYLDAGSLTRAALLAGFYDQSHFIRNFKKIVRLTPRQYRAARCDPPA